MNMCQGDLLYGCPFTHHVRLPLQNQREKGLHRQQVFLPSYLPESMIPTCWWSTWSNDHRSTFPSVLTEALGFLGPWTTFRHKTLGFRTSARAVWSEPRVKAEISYSYLRWSVFRLSQVVLQLVRSFSLSWQLAAALVFGSTFGTNSQRKWRTSAMASYGTHGQCQVF